MPRKKIDRKFYGFHVNTDRDSAESTDGHAMIAFLSADLGDRDGDFAYAASLVDAAFANPGTLYGMTADTPGVIYTDPSESHVPAAQALLDGQRPAIPGAPEPRRVTLPEDAEAAEQTGSVQRDEWFSCWACGEQSPDAKRRNWAPNNLRLCDPCAVECKAGSTAAEIADGMGIRTL